MNDDEDYKGYLTVSKQKYESSGTKAQVKNALLVVIVLSLCCGFIALLVSIFYAGSKPKTINLTRAENCLAQVQDIILEDKIKSIDYISENLVGVLTYNRITKKQSILTVDLCAKKVVNQMSFSSINYSDDSSDDYKGYKGQGSRKYKEYDNEEDRGARGWNDRDGGSRRKRGYESRDSGRLDDKNDYYNNKKRKRKDGGGEQTSNVNSTSSESRSGYGAGNTKSKLNPNPNSNSGSNAKIGSSPAQSSSDSAVTPSASNAKLQSSQNKAAENSSNSSTDDNQKKKKRRRKKDQDQEG